MLFRLFLAFSLIPLIEIYLLIKVGSRLGAGTTIAIVILTGFTGAYLARRQGLSTMRRVQYNMAQGITPAGEMVDALLIFIAGVLLLTPGFMTDAVGILLLVPKFRDALKNHLRRKFERMVREGHIHVVHHSGPVFRQGMKTIKPDQDPERDED